MFLMIFFILTALSFAVSASRGYGGAANAKEFFHVPGERRNIVSLAIADVTLGTGLVYLLTAASLNGLSMLLVTLATGLGYILFAKFMRVMNQKNVLKDGNLLLGIRSAFAGSSKRDRWLFDGAVTVPLIAIFLLLFAFELFASSSIIAAFVFPGISYGQLIVAGVLFAVCYVNCMAGGMQASYRNDLLLAVGILGLIAIVLIASLIGSPQDARAVNPQALLWGSSGFNVAGVAVLVGIINAVATQFYSLLNNYTASNFQSPDALNRSMVRVGIMVAILLSILVLVGSIFPIADVGKGFPTALAARLQGLWGGDGWLSYTAQAIIIFGMSAVVFSTIDTLMIALTYFVHRNLLSSEVSNETSVSIKIPRRTLTVLFALGFVPAAGLFLLQPNLFYLLLSIAAGAAIFAPFLISQGFAIAYGRKGGSSKLFLAAVFAVFALTAISSGYATVIQSTVGPYISLGAFSIAVLVSLSGYFASTPKGGN